MCGPIVGIVAGGLLSAASSVYQGNAQAAAYSAQAQTAEQNRATSERQASEALASGAREEASFRRQARQFAATQESQLAASGVQLSGSALNVMQDTASGIEEDATMIQYNTLKSKWGYDVQATNFANEASALRSSATNARRAGRVGAFTSLLGAGVNAWGAAGTQHSTARNGRIAVDSAPLRTISGTIQYDKSMGVLPNWWGG